VSPGASQRSRPRPRLTSQNLAPIWLPHWPPWMCTISRMFACVFGRRGGTSEEWGDEWENSKFIQLLQSAPSFPSPHPHPLKGVGEGPTTACSPSFVRAGAGQAGRVPDRALGGCRARSALTTLGKLFPDAGSGPARRSGRAWGARPNPVSLRALVARAGHQGAPWAATFGGRRVRKGLEVIRAAPVAWCQRRGPSRTQPSRSPRLPAASWGQAGRRSGPRTRPRRPPLIHR
jgi:hypothetical protein